MSIDTAQVVHTSETGVERIPEYAFLQEVIGVADTMYPGLLDLDNPAVVHHPSGVVVLFTVIKDFHNELATRKVGEKITFTDYEYED